MGETGERKAYKILVVDDEPDLERLMMQRMRRDIRSGRLNFIFARNGVEALARLSGEGDVDMVISDINMPEMDGLTLLEQIPSVDPNVRSVIISAYGDMKNIRTAMNRGAFDFVTKPIDFEDLRVTIDRTLRHLAMLRKAMESHDKLVALRNELDIAYSMQQSILPTEFPQSPLFDVFGSMEPARDVGGDFFEVLNLPGGRVGLAVADVSGKGVPSALFMMSSSTLLRGAAVGRTSPDEVLKEINRLLYENNEAAMFVTVFFCIFDPATGELVFANGGHNPPLVVGRDGSSRLLEQTAGVALGVVPDVTYEQRSVTLDPGEMMVLYTDGVTEAENEDQEQFRVERLQAVYAGGRMTNAREANEAVFRAVREFAGDARQFDDITCLTLRRTASPS